MTTLVTGGAGFVGRPLAAHLARRGHRVLAADRLSAAEALAGLPGEVAYRQVDVADRAAVARLIEDTRPEIVVHTAAVVGVAASVGAGVMPTVQVNIAGSVNLFEALHRVGGVRRLIDLSSEEYYGDFATDPLPETAPAAPVSPYGISKFAVERLGRFYAETAGLPYVAARLCWVYGPGFPRTRLPAPWLDDIAAGRVSILERGGDQRIDFTHIDDVVQGLTLLAEAGTLRHRAYHLATGRAATLHEMAGILRRLRPQWRARVGDGGLELAPGVPAARKGALDITRAHEELGYTPRVSLAAGLESNLLLVEAAHDSAHDSARRPGPGADRAPAQDPAPKPDSGRGARAD
ncbi:NAD-dependent epimerase/dehydratase family protein [Streptomyces hoynatensis]|uniref:NAD-dependent epimerase/dehydratase family protein n=1 Tax=Streptomyces hoynatensis TaxID=1141874 RepID=UPI001319D80B|nr:SDR family NAD(P)-dependent oxidoreductase [Streptomyces hoynatensis]